MLKKGYIVIAFVMILILLGIQLLNNVMVAGTQETCNLERRSVPFPSGFALGIAWDQEQTVYVASYDKGSIVAINISSLEYQEYFIRPSKSFQLVERACTGSYTIHLTEMYGLLPHQFIHTILKVWAWVK